MSILHRLRRGHWPRWHACTYDGVGVGYECWDCPHPFHLPIAGEDPV